MLEVKNLSFAYKTKNVLKDINLTVKDNETVFLIGKNGAGKTTLFKCMLGLLKGYGGDIYADKENIKAISSSNLAKHIAYIPQSNYPTFNYSVMDMVLMGTAHNISSISQPGQKQVDKCLKALERVGIYGLRDSMFMQLSGGERQLVLISRALAQDAKILFMDEPTSSLDYGNQIRVMKTVRELTETGYTTIISCHNPQQAMTFGSRIVALDGGCLIADGHPQSVLSAALIERLYGIEADFENTVHGTVIVPRC